MEANRKRTNRGFLKGKLAPFYKSQTTKSFPTTTTKVNKPNHSSPSSSLSSSSPSSFGVVHHHQDYAVSQAKPNPKVSIIVADGRGGGDLMSRLEEFYGVPADESVDIKAKIYISMVQERLSLERVNSNESIPNKFQEKN
ncbi:uncharacterized protein LOC130936413 [Arachis stenosperma]|uniref:uncharacterized protein LOC130936413 n=1 Tax=Arachis stenosperma TaxID=217475 RepID=UPI0025AC2138|nr:uncharacterized protein LOC130936413 [Arachis stenosperma]